MMAKALGCGCLRALKLTWCALLRAGLHDKDVERLVDSPAGPYLKTLKEIYVDFTRELYLPRSLYFVSRTHLHCHHFLDCSSRSPDLQRAVPRVVLDALQPDSFQIQGLYAELGSDAG